MPDVFELIQQLCPDGVEYKEIQDISKTVSPKVKIKSKDYLDRGKYPVIDQGQNYIGGYTNKDVVFPDGEYVIFGDHTCVVKFVDFQFAQGADGVKVIAVESDVLPKFLYYCMRNIHMVADYTRHWSKMKMKKIPVPPLPVQKEIVRILDAFDTYCNDMTAGLAGELEMRRKQFQYWREQLIDRQHDYNAVLGYFFTQVSRKAGANFPKEQLRVVSNTMGLVSKDDYEQRTQDASEDLCNYKLVGSGEFAYNPRRFDVGSVAYNKESDDMAVSPAYQVFSVEGIHPDYLMHLFRHSGFHRQRIQYTEKGAGSKFTFDKFQYVSMPVPPMDVQLEIVAVLNKFQELERELERELELRKKQFEYYRDKLLTFPEKAVN